MLHVINHMVQVAVRRYQCAGDMRNMNSHFHLCRPHYAISLECSLMTSSKVVTVWVGELILPCLPM